MKTYKQLTQLEKDFLRMAKHYIVTDEKMTIQYNEIRLTLLQTQTETSYVYQLIQDDRKIIYEEEEAIQ